MADLMQQAREQFEAWMMTQTTHGNEHVLTRVGGCDERYLSPLTSSMWAAWQAALRAAPEGGVPERTMMALATGWRRHAASGGRGRAVLIQCAESLEAAVIAARPQGVNRG